MQGSVGGELGRIQEFSMDEATQMGASVLSSLMAHGGGWAVEIRRVTRSKVPNKKEPFGETKPKV